MLALVTIKLSHSEISVTIEVFEILYHIKLESIYSYPFHISAIHSPYNGMQIKGNSYRQERYTCNRNILGKYTLMI